MKRLRATHLILTVTTMLSLFVSAVSACACSHHEQVKIETSSCHSSSHEVPPAVPSEGSTHFETDCNCFVRTPVPAIFAKNDDKRTALEEQPADAIDAAVVFAIDIAATDTIVVSIAPSQSNYKHALLSSLPSRAPPRL